MGRISKHLSYEEGMYSDTAIREGIDNTPSASILGNMELVAIKIFEPVREHVDRPIHVSSFYRCDELNTAVGSSSRSSHPKGQAIDMVRVGFNKIMFDYIKNNLSFDQLIWEHGNDHEPKWVHVSYVSGRDNRNQVLRISKENGRTITRAIS